MTSGNNLHIAIVEPFYTGSHRTWVDNLKRVLPFSIDVYTLPGRHWKWRMAAGSIELAQMLNEVEISYDIILATDMLDLASFKALIQPKHQQSKIVLYMHENQIVYPFQTKQTEKSWDRHYGIINYKSVLCANQIWFNSEFHKHIFYRELDAFLSDFPESRFYRDQAKAVMPKSGVIPVGVDFEKMAQNEVAKSVGPTILWNHRWEHDKNPDLFFNSLIKLSEEGLKFDLIVVGESFNQHPEIFAKAKKALSQHIIQWGYFANEVDYHKAVWSATILPVTSNQEFFGISVMEAIYCGLRPILPKRLSYTDLYQGLDVFYENDMEFYTLLKAAIVTNERADYQKHVSKYDWNSVGLLYEAALLKVAT